MAVSERRQERKEKQYNQEIDKAKRKIERRTAVRAVVPEPERKEQNKTTKMKRVKIIKSATKMPMNGTSS